MGYDGFFSMAGIELANEQRTRAYIEHQLPGFPMLKNFPVSTTLNVALEEGQYESPLIDDAEWVNPLDLPTLDFFGMYPLDTTGIGDSTRSADVVEAIGDGGSVGEGRDGTRQIRVHGLLVGANDLAVEAGLSWLRNALRTNDCGMHGVGCGSTDFRYFLADPVVCNPLWDSSLAGMPASSVTTDLGSLSPETGDLVVNFDAMINAPSYVRWHFQLTDGVVITWGGIARDNSDTVIQSGPVILQRTNFVANPSFTSDVSGWTASTGTLTRVATGGVDGGAYGHLEADSTTVRFNFFPDPGFVNDDPTASGWRLHGATTILPGAPGEPWGAGGYGDGGYGGGAGGYGMTLVRNDPDVTAEAEISLLGPATAILGTVSFWLEAHAQTITVTVYDNLGVLIHTESIVATGSDGRVSFESMIGNNYVVHFSTGDDLLHLADPMAETGTFGGDFFTGDSAAHDDTTYSWVGTPLLSASKELTGDPAPGDLTTLTPDTRYGELIANFALRSASGATLTAKIVSLDDGTVLAEEDLVSSFDWTVYSLSTEFGRNTKLVISGDGSYDIDQVVVEAGSTQWPYFDGSTAPLTSYVTSWLGLPNASYSRTSWTGEAITSENNSNYRPFIHSVQGRLDDVQVEIGTYPTISLDTQLDKYERNYHDVSALEGPSVIKRYSEDMLGVGSAIEVDFVIVAETPFAYSNGRDIDLSGLETALWTDPDEGDPTDPADALVDPDCPPIPAAPRPPVIPELCLDDPDDWRRYWLDIPAEDVALWASTVPTISLNTKGSEERQVRVRFYPNPFGYDKQAVDPLSYCGEFILSYLPANTLLTVNGVNETAFAQVAGGAPIPADHLLYGTGGTPMEWPSLSCGIPYVMTIDVPSSDDLTNLDIELVVNRRE